MTVPVDQQREALAFLAEAGFGENAYHFSSELLSHLGPDRWMHWGATPGADGRPDFPLHDWATAQQGSLLGQLLDPTILSRLRDAELRAPEGEPTLGLPELFATLTGQIWAELGTNGRPRNIGSVRRDLQRIYLNNLIRMLVNPAPAIPEDARTLARATLTDLNQRIERALGNSRDLDAYTRAHLADSRERINQTLNAQVIQTAGTTR